MTVVAMMWWVAACATDFSELFVGAGGAGGAAQGGAAQGGRGGAGGSAAPECMQGDLPTVEEPPPLCGTCDGCSLCEPRAGFPDAMDCQHACDACDCTCPAFECTDVVGSPSVCDLRCSENTSCAMMCDWFSCDLDCIGCRSANLVTGPSSGGSKLTCTDAESCQMECEHLNCWLEATRAEQASLIVGVGNAKLDCLGGSTCDVTGEQDLDFTVVDATATAECGAMGGSCLAACDGASDCTMKCNAADTCILSCDASGGAACLVECDTATTCDLACDGDTTLDCTGPAIKVCGRACP